MSVIRHVVVRGRVQGVGYRAFVEDAAARLNLEGWVRNRRDGSVEAVFAGSDQAVTDAIAACHRGPRHAVVDAVDVADGSAALLRERPAGERFAVLRTV